MAASSRIASDSSCGLAIEFSGGTPNFGSSSKPTITTPSSHRTQDASYQYNLNPTKRETHSTDGSAKVILNTLDAHDFDSKPSTREDFANESPIVPGGDTQSGKRNLLSNHSGQAAAEFKQILGNSNSRLKSGVELPLGLFFEPQMSHTGKELNIALEQAKSKSRVNLDILLESNICVQGGCLRGYIQIRVRKQLKKDKPIFLSGGRLRLMGFENMDTEAERSIFYQCSAGLSDITLGLERIYSSEPDSEGFSKATEGTHSLPFVFHLNSDSEIGTPKGSLLVPPGISIRYIAMVSLAIKDPSSSEKSIAHFYRDCVIWPRLNPSIVLAPTSRPIQVTASESLRKGGNGQVTLTASLHRLHWVSGQPCYARIKIANHSEKALKNLRLQLMRCTTLYRVGYKFEASDNDTTADAIADVVQSSTNTKLVAESLLEVCARRTRGHASAKGWWSGVIPGQTRMLSHHVLIPSDALSISRGNLVEVSYTLQVVIQVGTILPTEVKVSLPIEIINFLSIDPPPSTFMINLPGVNVHEVKPSGSQSSELESPMQSEHNRADSDFGQEDECSSGDETYEGSDNPTDHIQINIPLAGVDAEEKSPPRFADLYYSSLQDNLDKAAQEFFDTRGQVPECMQNASGRVDEENSESTFATRVRDKYLQRQAMLASNASHDDQGQDPQEPYVNSDTGAAPGMEASPLNPTASSEAGCHVRSTSHTRQNAHTQRNKAMPIQKIQQASLSESVFNNVSNTPPETAQQSQTEPKRTPISGVALPDDCIPKPYWKTPTSSKILPPVPNDEDTGKCNRPNANSELEIEESHSIVTPAVPTRVGSPSAPRAGSVKDKIRELEELAAKTDTDT